MTEFAVETVVAIVCAACLFGAVLKIWTVRGVVDPLCGVIRLDWCSEIVTYVVGFIYAVARVMDWLPMFHYGLTATLTGSMCAANFATSILVYRQLRSLQQRRGRHE